MTCISKRRAVTRNVKYTNIYFSKLPIIIVDKWTPLTGYATSLTFSCDAVNTDAKVHKECQTGVNVLNLQCTESNFLHKACQYQHKTYLYYKPNLSLAFPVYNKYQWFPTLILWSTVCFFQDIIPLSSLTRKNSKITISFRTACCLPLSSLLSKTWYFSERFSTVNTNYDSLFYVIHLQMNKWKCGFIIPEKVFFYIQKLCFYNTKRCFFTYKNCVLLYKNGIFLIHVIQKWCLYNTKMVFFLFTKIVFYNTKTVYFYYTKMVQEDPHPRTDTAYMNTDVKSWYMTFLWPMGTTKRNANDSNIMSTIHHQTTVKNHVSLLSFPECHQATGIQ